MVLGSAAATAAGAQSLALQALLGEPTTQTISIATLNEAAFAPRTGAPAVVAADDDIARVLDHETYAPGLGPVVWTSNELQLSRPSPTGPVDTLRVSVGGALRTPGGLPLSLDRSPFQADAYDVALIRAWPGALSYDAAAFNIDLSPHAGFGMTSDGGSAEAGATLRLSQRVSNSTAERLRDLGVRDGAALGGQGRWYLFAAASGRAVGLNMLRNDLNNGWDRAGWTTDPSSTLVGDAQVGVGWRKGDLQTSLGYVHRKMKGAHMIWGQETRQDSMVAFSLSIRPGRY
jgi:hypothetical protein